MKEVEKVIRKRLNTILFALFCLFIQETAWSQMRFGETLCKLPDYFCIKVNQNDTWENLFVNVEERDIIRRINRMNINLRPGMTLAIPKNIDRLTIYDVSPFPRYIDSTGEKTIYVSQKQLAWGAYDEAGELLWWGPLSSGSGHCRGVDGTCTTPSGSFRIIRKQDQECISTAFPIRSQDEESGGAPMPYCMHFFRGFALHGSDTVPGYKASHGCVRLFIEDARWLNEEFITLPSPEVKGTKVVVDD